MTDGTHTKPVRRRDFLKAAGLAGGGAAAVALAVAPTKAAAVSGTGAKAAGYRETEHIRKYYELARL